MKKLVSLILSVAMALSITAVACADGRIPPEDKKLIENDAAGVVTRFRKYDAKFWDAESPKP